MSRVIQAIIDEALKLESDLNTANECLDDVIAQREEYKQQLALTVGELRDAQRELERPQQDLRDYQKTIRNLEDQINTLKNTPPAPGPWDNRMVLLPGYGTVLAIQLYEQGWPEAAISCLVCPPLDTMPTYSEWYRTYGQSNGWIPPQPPGLPSVALSDDQSHWVAVPDVADEPEAVQVQDPEYSERLEKHLGASRQRNRDKPKHDE